MNQIDRDVSVRCVELERLLHLINHPMRVQIINAVIGCGNKATMRSIIELVNDVDYLVRPQIYKLKQGGLLHRYPPDDYQEHIYRVNVPLVKRLLAVGDFNWGELKEKR